MVADWRDATFRYIVKGLYGFEFSNFLKQYSVPFVFLDIGANQGLYSILASQNMNCQQVHAFEPVAETFDRLRQNMALNSCESISCYQKAIGKNDERKTICFSGTHSGVASMRDDALIDVIENGNQLLEIECIGSETLSLEVGEVNVAVIVKIDVEGYEEAVLDTLLSSSFCQNIHAVYVEIDEAWVSRSEVHRRLRQLNLIPVFRNGSNDAKHYDELWLS